MKAIYLPYVLFVVLLTCLSAETSLAFVDTYQIASRWKPSRPKVFAAKKISYVVDSRSTQASALSAVEFFDGSQIVDPVIVSEVFWTKLQSNFLSFIIGQFLAATVFAGFLSLASSQVGSIVEAIKGTLSPKSSSKSSLNIPAELSVDGVAKRNRDIDVKKLAVCLLIDIIGTSSEAIPIAGEFTDILWAPIAATTLRSLFGGGNNIVFGLEFAEEILPFTDILPLATLCWVVDTFYEESEVAKVLRLGVYQERQA